MLCRGVRSDNYEFPLTAWAHRCPLPPEMNRQWTDGRIDDKISLVSVKGGKKGGLNSQRVTVVREAEGGGEDVLWMAIELTAE